MNSKPLIVEPPYFSNWVDQIMPKIANLLLPLVARINFITPNHLTLASFLLYLFGSVILFTDYELRYWVILLLPLSYIFDCMDGQLARLKSMGSELGNYLDKTLDVLKIYIITLSLSLAVYFQTFNILHLILGFTACFFFNYRYYIKHETLLSQFSKDSNYLEKSKQVRLNLYKSLNQKHKENSRTMIGKLKVFLFWQRSIFFVDEGEFIFFTILGILFNRLDLVLWVFAISQTFFGFWRLFERGYQITHKSDRLLLPMRR